MSKTYSSDLRERVVSQVNAGHSRREVACRFGVSPSFVVKLMQLVAETGSSSAAKRGRPFGHGKLAGVTDALVARVEALPAVIGASGGAACVLGPGWCPAWVLLLDAKLSTDPDFSPFRTFGNVQKIRMEKTGCVFPIAISVLVGTGDVDRVRPIVVPDCCGCQTQLDFMGGKIGHGMSPRVRTHNQNNTIDASAMADRKSSGHLS